jgi:NADPH:quinone reductase-like Zn-dependent oxidoreductase
MKAIVYHGPGQKAWEEVPDPEITDDGDVIVRVDATTICGTDLHILKGDVPEVHQGRILGHEAVGTVAPLPCRTSRRIRLDAVATSGPGACQPASVPVSTGMQAPLIAAPPAPARNVISPATSVVSTNRRAGCSAIMLAITSSRLIPRRRM